MQRLFLLKRATTHLVAGLELKAVLRMVHGDVGAVGRAQLGAGAAERLVPALPGWGWGMMGLEWVGAGCEHACSTLLERVSWWR